MNTLNLLIQSVIQLNLLIQKQSILIEKNRHYFWFELYDLSPAGRGEMQGFLIKKRRKKKADQYVKRLMWKSRDSVMADGRETSDSFENWKTVRTAKDFTRKKDAKINDRYLLWIDLCARIHGLVRNCLHEFIWLVVLISIRNRWKQTTKTWHFFLVSVSDVINVQQNYLHITVKIFRVVDLRLRAN